MALTDTFVRGVKHSGVLYAPDKRVCKCHLALSLLVSDMSALVAAHRYQQWYQQSVGMSWYIASLHGSTKNPLWLWPERVFEPLAGGFGGDRWI